jgi:hypothetical protein
MTRGPERDNRSWLTNMISCAVLDNIKDRVIRTSQTTKYFLRLVYQHHEDTKRLLFARSPYPTPHIPQSTSIDTHPYWIIFTKGRKKNISRLCFIKLQYIKYSASKRLKTPYEGNGFTDPRKPQGTMVIQHRCHHSIPQEAPLYR